MQTIHWNGTDPIKELNLWNHDQVPPTSQLSLSLLKAKRHDDDDDDGDDDNSLMTKTTTTFCL